jgi:hypothetical protein
MQSINWIFGVLLAALIAMPAAAQDMIGTCGELPDKLAACEKFSCEFKHPFTGDNQTRTVKGMEGDKCLYHESMPNKGSMDCSYDEAWRIKVADFYRSYFTTGNPPAGGNLLNEALGDGTCQVSGY